MKIHIVCTGTVILSVKCSTHEGGAEKTLGKLRTSHLLPLLQFNCLKCTFQ